MAEWGDLKNSRGSNFTRASNPSLAALQMMRLSARTLTTKKSQIFFVISALLFLLTGMSADSLFAEQKQTQKGKPQQQSAAEVSVKKEIPQGAKSEADTGCDIILLMDSSGSMKKTDPHNHRKDAARLFVNLLRENDRVGIISFGDSARILVPATANSKTNQEKIFNAINKISSTEFSTNITAGIKVGFEALKSSARKNRYLILMSDGKLALGSKEKDETAFAELLQLLPELTKADVKLHSIAFTEMSDIKLLENIAKETNGFFRLAKTDKDIHLIFSSVFEKIKSPDTIPIQGDTFNIDKDITEAILVITKKATVSSALIEPSGKKHTPEKFGHNIQWYAAKAFDMITIKEPPKGVWKVKLSEKEGNKVFVITNLSLKSSFDQGFVNKDEKIKIDAWLERDEGVIKEKEVLEQVLFLAEVVTADGNITKLDLQNSGDNKFFNEYVASSLGDHTIKITAEGKTFRREKVLQFKVVEKPAQVPVQAPLPAAEPPASPLPTSVPVTVEDASLKPVLIKFGLINLAAVLLIAVIYFARKKISRNKTTRETGK